MISITVMAINARALNSQIVQIRRILLAFCFSVFALCTFAQDFPEKPSTLVNDYTNTLSPDQVNALEQKLVAFDDSTSIQVAVVIIKSLNGYDISEYGARLGEKWGVGRDKKNNGLVFLVAIEDRKVTLQTGYGLEGAVPDAIARRIIENEVKPAFKAGDYYGGIDRGTDAIIAYTKGEYVNEEPKKGKQSKGIPVGLIILIVIIIISFISRGGGGNQVIGRGGSSPLWWMLLGNALGSGGRSSGGGFGGGGGGGGFGGFGGGSFGGGGASGSW